MWITITGILHIWPNKNYFLKPALSMLILSVILIMLVPFICSIPGCPLSYGKGIWSFNSLGSFITKEEPFFQTMLPSWQGSLSGLSRTAWEESDTLYSASVGWSKLRKILVICPQIDSCTKGGQRVYTSAELAHACEVLCI